MTLYKQPHGSAMQKRGDEKKDGIFARLKAKRDAKKSVNSTKEAMGHNVKEENKIENKKIADEVFELEKKTTVPENAKLSIETSNSSMGYSAKQITEAAGNTGHSGFTEGNNPNSGGHESYMNIDRSNVSNHQSWSDITRQSDLDNSGHVEGKVQAFTGKTTSLKATTGTFGKVAGANASVETNVRMGETTVRSNPEYASTVDGKGIGVGIVNDQIKYRMPGTGTFSEKGFGANVDAGFKISNNNISAKLGGGYSTLMPKGSRGYGFVEGGIKGNITSLNQIRDKNYYKASNIDVSLPFGITGRASTGAPKMSNSYLPMNSLNRNSGFKGSIGLNIRNVAQDRSIEFGIQKDYQSSSINPYLKASFRFGQDKRKKKFE
jgi:hypothetical protein